MKRRITTFLTALAVILASSAVAATPASAAILGPYRLKPPGYNICLDVQGVSQADGATIQLYDCLPNQYNQQWYLQPSSDGSARYEIKAAHSGKCLDVEGVSQNAGARVQQYTCIGWWQYNQQWALVPTYSAGVPDGNYWLSVRHSGMCLSYPTWIANGAEIFQDWCGDKWSLVPW